MGHEGAFSEERLRELMWRALAAERTPGMHADIAELAARFEPRERAVIGRFLEHVQRAADAYARRL